MYTYTYNDTQMQGNPALPFLQTHIISLHHCYLFIYNEQAATATLQLVTTNAPCTPKCLSLWSSSSKTTTLLSEAINNGTLLLADTVVS